MWVELPFLKFYFKSFIRDIATQLGRVLWCQNSTDKFAILRVHPQACVEMDLTYQLPENIKLIGPGVELL